MFGYLFTYLRQYLYAKGKEQRTSSVTRWESETNDSNGLWKSRGYRKTGWMDPAVRTWTIIDWAVTKLTRDGQLSKRFADINVAGIFLLFFHKRSNDNDSSSILTTAGWEIEDWRGQSIRMHVFFNTRRRVHFFSFIFVFSFVSFRYGGGREGTCDDDGAFVVLCTLPNFKYGLESI